MSDFEALFCPTSDGIPVIFFQIPPHFISSVLYVTPFSLSWVFCKISWLPLTRNLFLISSIISPFLLFLLCADFFQPCHPVLSGEHTISNLSKKWFQQGDLLWLVRVLEPLSSRLFQSQHAWDGKMHGLEKGKRKMWKVKSCCIFHPKWLVVTLKTKGKQLNSSNLLDIKVIKLNIKVTTESNWNVTVVLFSQMADVNWRKRWSTPLPQSQVRHGGQAGL